MLKLVVGFSVVVIANDYSVVEVLVKTFPINTLVGIGVSSKVRIVPTTIGGSRNLDSIDVITFRSNEGN